MHLQTLGLLFFSILVIAGFCFLVRQIPWFPEWAKQIIYVVMGLLAVYFVFVAVGLLPGHALFLTR